MSGTILVTGSSGFIGFHLCQRLLSDGWQVVGIDAMTDYYDVSLKDRRQAMLCQSRNFRAVNDRIEQPGLLADLFADQHPEAVIHLAAQAGVRYSIEAPESYVEANLIGTFRLLEAAGRALRHLDRWGLEDFDAAAEVALLAPFREMVRRQRAYTAAPATPPGPAEPRELGSG